MIRTTWPAVLLALLLMPASPLGRAWAEEDEPAPTGKEILERSAELEGHTSLVRSLAFDPTGKVLVTGGADRSLRIWDVATAKQTASVVLPRGG